MSDEIMADYDVNEAGDIRPAVVGQDLMPFDEMSARLSRRREFIKTQLKEGIDYGKVPGVPKPFMWKSGAEKLLELHGYLPIFKIIDSESVIDGQVPYFEYTVSCDLLHAATRTEVHLGAMGCCSNRERQYFNSQSGQPKGDPWVQKNTVLKMAQKRAVVAAALAVTSLSCDFTQDEEAVEVQSTPSPSRPVPQRQQPAQAELPQDMYPTTQEDIDFPPPERPQQRPQYGNQQQGNSPQVRDRGAPCSDKQAKYIFRLVKENNMDVEEFMNGLRGEYGDHIGRLQDLTKGQANDVINGFVNG